MMGFSTEDKYLMKSLRENEKYGAKQLLKTAQVLLFDVLGSGRHRTVLIVLVLSIFWSALSVHQDSSFVRKHFKQ